MTVPQGKYFTLPPKNEIEGAVAKNIRCQAGCVAAAMRGKSPSARVFGGCVIVGLLVQLVTVLCDAAPTNDTGRAAAISSTNAAAPTDMMSMLKGKKGGMQQGASSNRNAKIEIKADALDYDRKTGFATAKGHVVIQKGDEELRADYVQINMTTEDANAVGNVVLNKAGNIWRGDKLRYNFKTGVGDIAETAGNMAPFHVKADKTEKVGKEFIFQNADITTCTNDWSERHWHVAASEMEVVPGEYVKAHSAMFYLGSFPIMYMPYWYRNLNDDFGFSFLAGASSEMGVFLLSSYRYPISDDFSGETHVDYRSKRGVAYGQDVRWHALDGACFGELSTYYLKDKSPDDEGDDANTVSDRNRVKLKNTYNMTEKDSLLVQANYLSDPYILEDFFEDEYLNSSQPENYIMYTHREEDYTANLLASGRLNDFYTSVNRMPEASVDFSKQEIDDTILYYEGQTAAAFLQEAHAAGSGVEDYTAFRLDSSHMVYCPEKYFGFLNVTPRTGYRGTFYSATIPPGQGPVTTTNVTVGANGTTNTTVTTNSLSHATDGPAMVRSRVEIGCEMSFKAFKTWDDEDMPLRHIVEPYMNYTLVEEPTTTNNLYQFDNVDTLVKEQSVKVGARNILQTKHGNSPFDLIDLDTYTILNIERSDESAGAGQEFFNNIYFDATITPVEGFMIKSDAQYDVPNSDWDTFNIEIRYADSSIMSADINYRFTKDDSSLVSENTTFYLSREWFLNVYGNYEFDDSQLGEIGGYIQRNYDCLAVRTGMGFVPGYTNGSGVQTKNEWRLTLEFWLTAFPEAKLGDHRQ
jgi:lipopolysaccharide assembly outer membrane protein LptD (OstA)